MDGRRRYDGCCSRELGIIDDDGKLVDDVNTWEIVYGVSIC